MGSRKPPGGGKIRLDRKLPGRLRLNPDMLVKDGRPSVSDVFSQLEGKIVSPGGQGTPLPGLPTPSNASRKESPKLPQLSPNGFRPPDPLRMSMVTSSRLAPESMADKSNRWANSRTSILGMPPRLIRQQQQKHQQLKQQQLLQHQQQQQKLLHQQIQQQLVQEQQQVYEDYARHSDTEEGDTETPADIVPQPPPPVQPPPAPAVVLPSAFQRQTESPVKEDNVFSVVQRPKEKVSTENTLKKHGERNSSMAPDTIDGKSNNGLLPKLAWPQQKQKQRFTLPHHQRLLQQQIQQRLILEQQQVYDEHARGTGDGGSEEEDYVFSSIQRLQGRTKKEEEAEAAAALAPQAAAAGGAAGAATGDKAAAPGAGSAVDAEKEATAEALELEKEERIMKILSGCQEDMPSMGSRIVRIFTSSTFTDTGMERTALMETVYPRLKEYCKSLGLEFQVVDMRWGVRDEATDDHMTTQLCMTEIDNCQRLSVGPNFVTLLGQKYGYRPIPTIIVGSEYLSLREIIAEVPDDVQLLDQWYICDDNAVPNEYILQPISTILTNFNNRRHQKLMEADQNKWWEYMERLQKMLRKAAQVLFMARKFTRDQMHNYFMSVTEREVWRGLINTKEKEKHCMAYLRNIENINLSAIRYARNYIDMAGRDVDEEAQMLLSTLRDVNVPAAIEPTNVHRMTLEWTGKEGVDAVSHAQYLVDFCEHFHANMVKMVDQGVEAQRKLTEEPIYSEVLQHLHACVTFSQMFQGREDCMRRIHQYIVGPNNAPMIMWGESGCGKTSVLAKAYTMIVEWKPQCSPVRMLRFCGTSPDSSAIIPLLTSLCVQIAWNFELQGEEIPDEMSPLCVYFKKQLAHATAERPIVIFLDSLDQLSPTDGAHGLAWLPTSMPPNVKFLVSTLPNYCGILDTSRKMINSEENYLEITPLGEELGDKVIKSWLEAKSRTVSESQWKIVTEALSKCNLPLYVKLVFGEVIRWKSYSKPSITTVRFTIHDSINKLLDRVELAHGKILVAHALAYLTASKCGLSEAELEDLLSLDEKVLNDVYQYHLPPVRRIPSLLWTRIRSDLPSYFAEREADGANVIFWYHRQFIEASRERYFKNINFLNEIHSNIADYFLGIWGGVPKPFEYSELQRMRFGLEETKGESDRKVPLQPLYYPDPVTGKVKRYNLRKLNELPFQLVRSKRFDDLNKEVLFNFRWLHAKLCSFPLTAALFDYEDAMEHLDDKNIKILTDTLSLSASVLSRHPHMVGPQIVGRLLPYYNVYQKIGQLIQQCDSDGTEVNALVPIYHCLHTPGGPLQFSLEGHAFAPFGVTVTSDARYLVSVSNIFIIWDLLSGDVFRTITPGIKGIMQNLVISDDDRTAISYTNNDTIVICHITTGDFQTFEPPLVTNQQEAIIGCSVSNTHFSCWTFKEWFLYTNNGEPVEKALIPKNEGTIIQIEIGEHADVYLVKKVENPIAGVETIDDMSLEVHCIEPKVEDFFFHSAIALTKDKQYMYTCLTLPSYVVECYVRDGTKWKLHQTLAENEDKLFSLMLSKDECFLIGAFKVGYKLWLLTQNKMLTLDLPEGVRNIPVKNQITSPVIFTMDSQYVVACVRKIMYVWDTSNGELKKTLDAHFGRIIQMVSVLKTNKVISSSIDKTIKVWNFENILEDVHSIDRHEKPIDNISLAGSAFTGATATRNCVGIWNLECGKLLKTLSNSPNAIVSHALITSDGFNLVSAESGHVLIWDIEKEMVIRSDNQRDVLQMMLTEEDSKVIIISRVSAGRNKCVCRSIPHGDEIYQFEYTIRKFKNAVVTANGLFLIVPASDEKSPDILRQYHAKTGTHMFDMTPKYPDYKEYLQLVAMPSEPNHVALMDPDKGNVWDIKKKSFVRAVRKWNGVCSHNGKYGLFAPNRGGLELLDLKTGKTVHTFIPRVAEGVFNVMTMFMKNDQHVVYYHSGRRSIRLFRVADGEKIADYKMHAELKSMASTEGGACLVLGAVDGSVLVHAVCDPKNQSNIDFLRSMPSRMVITNSPKGSPKKSPSHQAQVQNGEGTNLSPPDSPSKLANGGGNNKFASVAQVARVAAKGKLNRVKGSSACILQ